MIKGLKRSVAEGGKIKIGGKGDARPTRDGSGTWAPPRKDDHFTITGLLREGGDPNANLIVNSKIMTALIEQGYADDDGKVRRLPISVLHDDVDLVFPTAYVAYAGKSLACRGDGETATRYIDPANGAKLAEPQQVSCPCERLEKDAKGTRRCKFSGILHCSLRIPGHAVIGSVYTWRTTSEISVSQVHTHLTDILIAAGTLRGLPLMLVMRPVQVSPGGRPTTVYVCHLDLCEELVIAQQQALQAATMRRELAGSLLAERDASYTATLQLPGAEADDEQAAVAAEFYVDEVVGTTPAGAAVETVTPDAVLDAPLAGLVVPPPDVFAADAPPAAPARPATPPPADESTKGKRRSRCTVCGELAFGVTKGMCPECSTPQTPPEPEPDPAPEISQTPYQRIQAAFKGAVTGRGLSQTAVLAQLAQVWPDINSRKPTDWTADEAEQACGIIAGME